MRNFDVMKFFFCFLLGAGMTAAGLISVSSAELRVPEIPSEPALRPVSGSLKAGYSTNYEFRGLIPGGCNPVAPLRLDLRSDLNDRYSLILALNEEIFLGHPAVDLENETMVDVFNGNSGRGLTQHCLSVRMTADWRGLLPNVCSAMGEQRMKRH